MHNERWDVESYKHIEIKLPLYFKCQTGTHPEKSAAYKFILPCIKLWGVNFLKKKCWGIDFCE